MRVLGLAALALLIVPAEASAQTGAQTAAPKTVPQAANVGWDGVTTKAGPFTWGEKKGLDGKIRYGMVFPQRRDPEVWSSIKDGQPPLLVGTSEVTNATVFVVLHKDTCPAGLRRPMQFVVSKTATVGIEGLGDCGATVVRAPGTVDTWVITNNSGGRISKKVYVAKGPSKLMFDGSNPAGK
jgi:hypothetical protein